MAKKRKSQALPRGLRAGIYFDGFNLYHAVDQLKKPHLKWTNLRSLGELLCRRYGAELQTVVFCTTLPDDDGLQRERHKTFNTAQKAYDVRVLPGHRMLSRDGEKLEEKQSDINLALAVILDAEDGLIDLAIVISADSDQAATAKVFRSRFPDKFFVTVAPPNRGTSEKIEVYAHARYVITPADLEACPLGDRVIGKSGNLVPRPQEYRRR
jgi:hypothetical protein